MKTTLDEIDKFLYDLVRVQPGACSSIENAKYIVARTVAEALWPKKRFQQGCEQAQKDLELTIDDVKRLDAILYAIRNNKTGVFTHTAMSDDKYELALERFKFAKSKQSA